MLKPPAKRRCIELTFQEKLFD